MTKDADVGRAGELIAQVLPGIVGSHWPSDFSDFGDRCFRMAQPPSFEPMQSRVAGNSADIVGCE
jgi:hypothetical protein